MPKPDKGMILVFFALLLLGGVIGWRYLGNTDSAAEEQLADAADLPAPPSLDDLEDAAQSNPDDPQGWQRLGLALFQSGQFAEAISAYERAVQADPESSLLWSSLGEARIMANENDPMPAAAVEAFEKALALDGGDPRARYFLAVRRDLSGDHQGALDDWLALLADTPPGAPWESDLVRTIQQVAAIHEITIDDRIAKAAGTRDLLPAADPVAANAAAGRGPTTEQMAAAAALPPSEQQTMAESMVERLATRLESEPQDVDGWVMLMRSYRQLGRDGAASRARDNAIAANPDAREQIEQAAQMLGVP